MCRLLGWVTSTPVTMAGLLGEDDLAAASATGSIVNQIAIMVGPLVAAVLIALRAGTADGPFGSSMGGGSMVDGLITNLSRRASSKAIAQPI